MCGHEDSVKSTEFLPFSNTALTRSADKTLSLWDAEWWAVFFLVFLEFKQSDGMYGLRKMKTNVKLK